MKLMQENHLDNQEKIIQSFNRFATIEEEHYNLLDTFYARARKLYPRSFEYNNMDHYSIDPDGIQIHLNTYYDNSYSGYVLLEWKYINMSDEEFETILKNEQ